MDRRDDVSRPDDGPDSVERSISHGGDADRAAPAITLKAALRRARIENAERTGAITDMRGAELTRLEVLRDHLAPVFAEVPDDCDMFDPGLAPGERPRLFIDAVAFIEMGHDRRIYRFVQDTRAGRVVLCESERTATIVRAVTDYVARRLVERERALGASALSHSAHTSSDTEPRQAGAPRGRPRGLRIAARAFLFVVEVIGSAVVFAALAAAAIWAWQTYVR